MRFAMSSMLGRNLQERTFVQVSFFFIVPFRISEIVSTLFPVSEEEISYN